MTIRQYIGIALLCCGRYRGRLVAVLQVFTVAAIVALTLVDVERDLGGELWLSRAVPVVMAVGAVACLVAGRGVMPTAIDAVVAVWWTAEAALCYAGCGVFAPGAFWAFSESVFLYFALRLLFSAGRQSGAWVAVLIMAGCLYESALGIYQLIADTSRHGLFPMTGTFLNPGPYSAYLAVGVALALSFGRAIKEFRSYRSSGVQTNAFLGVQTNAFSGVQELQEYRSSDKCMEAGDGRQNAGDVMQDAGDMMQEADVCPQPMPSRSLLPFYHFTLLLFYLFTFLPLIVAWSRAAWVAVAVVAACVYWRQLARYKYVVLALAVVGGVAAYLLKQGSADGRVVMWLGALKAIAADPWTGAGIGGFGGAYAEGVAALFADGGAQGLLQSANVTDYKIAANEAGGRFLIAATVDGEREYWYYNAPGGQKTLSKVKADFAGKDIDEEGVEATVYSEDGVALFKYKYADGKPVFEYPGREAGTYTDEAGEGEDLVLDGFGEGTYGDREGTYTIDESGMNLVFTCTDNGEKITFVLYKNDGTYSKQEAQPSAGPTGTYSTDGSYSYEMRVTVNGDGKADFYFANGGTVYYDEHGVNCVYDATAKTIVLSGFMMGIPGAWSQSSMRTVDFTVSDDGSTLTCQTAQIQHKTTGPSSCVNIGGTVLKKN